MSAAVADLSEYRLHRDCHRLVSRRADGMIRIHTPSFTYSVHPSVARILAEYANEVLSRCMIPVDVNGWKIGRSNMLGAIILKGPNGDVVPMNQEQGELFALALARVVGG